MSLPRCVENGRLAVVIDVVSFAALLQKQLNKVSTTLSTDVEKTGLAKGVLLRWVTLGFFDQVLSHFERLVVILDETTHKERILPVFRLIYKISDIIWLVEP